MRRAKPKKLIVLAAVLPVVFASSAHADDTIKHPGDHPDYKVEIEPHGLIGWWDNSIGGDAFGVGGRFTIPIVKNGFVPSINNSVGISFGLDYLFGGSWCGAGNCGINYLDFPVAMQWNFFVAQRWSVFGEPGLYVWHDFFSNCNQMDCPAVPSNTGVYPALWLGARYYFNDKVSLTMRVGFPTASIGVSFFP